MRIIIVSAMALGAAACSSDSAGPAATGGDLEMLAGNWSQTTVIESFEMPGVPPEVAEMLQQVVGQTQTSQTCMTRDQIKQGFEEQAQKSMAGQDCTTEDFSSDDGKLSGKIVCRKDGGEGAAVTIDGRYTPETMAMTMTAEITDPSMPGGSGVMVMKMTGERVGDCDA